MATKKPKQIKYKCKKCLKDIKFNLDNKPASKDVFPIILESSHGNPVHKLTIQLDKNYDVQSFKLEEEVEKVQHQEISKDVLKRLGLSSEEITLYLKCSGKGPITIGEMAIMMHLPKKLIEKIVLKFIEKGLFQKLQGTTNYYQALPPYAALLAQLNNFSDVIRGIKISTPTELHSSFLSFENKTDGVQNLTDFVRYLKGIKENLTKDIDKQKKNLDNSLGKLQEQKDIVASINSLRDESISLLDEHYINLFNQFELLKQKISTNIEKLQLGVVVKTVDNIIQTNIDLQMEKIRDEFQSQFEQKFKTILNQLNSQIGDMASSAGEMGDGLRESFTNVLTQFDESLSKTQNKLLNISDVVMDSFGSLKDDFSEKVVITLDDILGKMAEQIDMNIATIKDFWELSKGSINFTMQDVWFIRSPAGMVAQINDTLDRLKMKILIVAPTLSDIDIEPLKSVKDRINIRICTFINKNDPDHREKLKFFDSRHNIDYRHRTLQNLWAVSRDYEEIILGIINKKDTGSNKVVELAAVGSVLTEHIKIFVPVLEDAWVGATKNIPAGFDTKCYPIIDTSMDASSGPTSSASASIASASIASASNVGSEPIAAPVLASPKISAPSIESSEIKTKVPGFPEMKKKTPLASAAISSMHGRFEEEDDDSNQVNTNKNVNKMVPSSKKPIQDEAISFSGQIEPILKDLSALIEKAKPNEVLASLQSLHDIVSRKDSKPKISSDILKWVDELKGRPFLDDFKKKILVKRIEFWRENLSDGGN